MFKLLDGFKFFLNPAWVANMFFTLWGKGGGGGGGPTTQTSYSTNLPEYAKPFYEELMKQSAKQVYNTDSKGNVTGVKDFVPYAGTTDLGGGVTSRAGQRIADFTEGQKAVQQEVAGMQTPGGFGTAATGMGTGQSLGYGTAGLGLSQAFGYNPQAINAQNVQNQGLYQYQMGPAQNVAASGVGTQNFGQGAADYYMSPYAQAAINPALREARLQGDLQKQAGMTGAIGRGTFGGARQALLQAEQERGTQRTMGDIQATGMEKAYQNAQAQFQADQMRQLQAQQANQQYGLQAQLANQQAGLTTGQQNLQALLGIQQLGAGQSLEAQRANQAANLEAQKLNQQGQQFQAGLGKDLGLAGLQAGLEASSKQGALAATQQASDLERVKAQAASAGESQAMDQERLNQQYQQFMDQQNYKKAQMDYLSQILRGNAAALGTTQTQYAPAPSLASQLGGVGLAGLGLYNILGKK